MGAGSQGQGLLLHILVSRVLFNSTTHSRLVFCVRRGLWGHRGGDRRDLRQARRLRALRTGHQGAPALERSLVREAALAAEGVLEGDEEHEDGAGEDGEEPEGRPPVKPLREDSPENGT